MTNLPNSEQSGDLDNINVTRAQFRAEIGVFLEYVAQALGGVTGNYTTQAIDPAAPILQGAPTLEPGATPPDDSRDDRIPSTRWVQEHGRYVGSSAPSTPADGMLWIDDVASPYSLKTYNAGTAQWDVLSNFPSGTRMLFQQTAAPTGWTKDTSGIDNMALRTTTGTVSTVDSNQGFTTVFSSKPFTGTVGGHSLTENELAAHSHGVTLNDPGHSHSYRKPLTQGGERGSTGEITHTTASTGGQSTGITVSIQSNGAGAAHDHPFTGTNLDLQINYVDVIVAQKD